MNYGIQMEPLARKDSLSAVEAVQNKMVW